MIWHDVLFDAWPLLDSLRDAVAKAFRVPSAAVVVVDSPAFLPRIGSSAVACERVKLGGEFQLKLSIYVYDQALLVGRSTEEIVREVASALRARCLISDEAVNPYTMILITAEGARPVALNVEKLEHCEEYWIE